MIDPVDLAEWRRLYAEVLQIEENMKRIADPRSSLRHFDLTHAVVSINSQIPSAYQEGRRVGAHARVLLAIRPDGGDAYFAGVADGILDSLGATP